MPIIKNLYNVIYLPNTEVIKKIYKEHPSMRNETKPHTHWGEFMEYVVEEICSTRNGVDLPLSLGWLFMGVFPSKNNVFKEKRRYCETLTGTEPFRIQERDGFESRIAYTHTRSKKRAVDPTFYGFSPSREAKALGTTYFKKDWKKYVVIPNIRFMDGAMRKKEKIREINKDKLSKYNEFED